MMLESQPEKTRELLEKSMAEASTCLDETRTAMRELRKKKMSQARGIRAFFDLVSAFGEATGITVKVEFGNSPDSFGERIDKTIFRFIQEGLTNSFRHGRATEIRIYFWIVRGVLEIRLQDNGSGSGELSAGIGLAGMRERLGELGGSLTYRNIVDGFEVAIRIPLEGK